MFLLHLFQSLFFADPPSADHHYSNHRLPHPDPDGTGARHILDVFYAGDGRIYALAFRS